MLILGIKAVLCREVSFLAGVFSQRGCSTIFFQLDGVQTVFIDIHLHNQENTISLYGIVDVVQSMGCTWPNLLSTQQVTSPSDSWPPFSSSNTWSATGCQFLRSSESLRLLLRSVFFIAPLLNESDWSLLDDSDWHALIRFLQNHKIIDIVFQLVEKLGSSLDIHKDS
ncbi:hypothetical protein LAZ67_20000167 [Cordylochernes scorpioides]|uniref:Uncharacterized protein n=1 Tax=Cordylochernes scorpioides TaxID=51811 RepID=A0ABY6LJ01_9ARAC|nr:hypothetical protein LAZ67_20000167 [Cordylochernes scorpioides]